MAVRWPVEARLALSKDWGSQERRSFGVISEMLGHGQFALLTQNTIFEEAVFEAAKVEQWTSKPRGFFSDPSLLKASYQIVT